jgi:hypothetical protein
LGGFGHSHYGNCHLRVDGKGPTATAKSAIDSRAAGLSANGSASGSAKSTIDSRATNTTTKSTPLKSTIDSFAAGFSANGSAKSTIEIPLEPRWCALSTQPIFREKASTAAAL